MLTDLCKNGFHTHCWEDDCDCTECHFICTKCDHRVKKLYEGLCAPCERDRIKRAPTPQTLCERCGDIGAFRNPGTRRNEFFCATCHADSGDSVKLPGSITEKLVVACAPLPLSDRSHEFMRVRASRFRCRRCHQDAFGNGRGLNIVGDVR